jgi:hypothetical protein
MIQPRHAAPNAYEQLREILLRYASRITVEGLLGSALARAKVDPHALDGTGLERLIAEVSPGIRVFCKTEDVPKLMLELAGLFD